MLGITQEQLYWSRVGLLRQFYNSLDTAIVKLECRNYDFETLETIQKSGTIDYSEVKRCIAKHRISNLQAKMFPGVLYGHVRGSWNICGYWHPERNTVFAMNFDDENGNKMQEMNYIIATAGVMLEKVFKIPSIFVSSGRGYHLWIRTAEPVENYILRSFMYNFKHRILEYAKNDGFDITGIGIYCYPMRNVTANSLRLFGSIQTRTKEFSHIYTLDREYALSENESWDYFERYLRNCSTTQDQIIVAASYLKDYAILKKAGA